MAVRRLRAATIQDTITDLPDMNDPDRPQSTPPGSISPPAYRPSERFWPYVDLPEFPTEEELAELDPDLRAALYGAPARPFSITLVFPPFAGPEYDRAVEMARASAEYREVSGPDGLRHRARFYAGDTAKLRDLFQIVGSLDACEVLVDDRPVPYARELWLPLVWLLPQ